GNGRRRALEVETLAAEVLGEAPLGRLPVPELVVERDVLWVAAQRSGRIDFGQMPCLPGIRMPFGSSASLIVSVKRRYAWLLKLYWSAARSIKSRCARYSPYPAAPASLTSTLQAS